MTTSRFINAEVAGIGEVNSNHTLNSHTHAFRDG